MIRTKTSVETSGRAFAPGIDRELDAVVVRAERDIGQEGVNLIQARLGQVLRNPTGYYRSHVVTDMSVSDVAVTDSGVVYGPWLEGVSSRNTRSRFKGYHTFRLAAQELERRAENLADKAVGNFVKGLD